MFASEDAAGTETFPAELIGSTVDSEEETTATVTVDYRTREGSDDSETFDLVNENGSWLVTAESAGVPGVDGSGGGGSGPATGEGGGSGGGSGSGSGNSGTVTPPTTEGSSVDAGEPTSPPLDDPELVADPTLAGYAQSCYDGDMSACDELYWGTEIGTVGEAYGRSCGGRVADGSISGGSCSTELG